jgi:hypothetical protein
MVRVPVSGFFAFDGLEGAAFAAAFALVGVFAAVAMIGSFISFGY